MWHNVTMSKRIPPASPLLLATATYFISVGVLWARQTQILYRPPKKVFCQDPTEVLLPGSGSDPSLRGWVDGPREASECVIYFGGSSESVELRRPNLAGPCSDMTRYFMPYRGFGPNWGMKITESGIKADGIRLFDRLAARHDRVHVVARSLGTGVGLAVAANRDVDRLALITPYDSIAAVAREKYRIVPTGRLLRDKFESWRDAANIQKPALVCLAGLDKVISPRRWEELKKHFKVPPVETVFKHCDHSNIADCEDMWNQIGSFLGNRPCAELTTVQTIAPQPGSRLRLR